jgi:hypothetical protein
MNVKELIKELEQIEDQELDVMFDSNEIQEIIDGQYENHEFVIDDNIWIEGIQEMPTGKAGYELYGCVIIHGDICVARKNEE